MAFIFDPKKNRHNLKQHGIYLEEACKLWEFTHVIIPAKNISGESRKAIIGTIDRKIYVTIYAERDNDIRLISCHRADKRWERIYYEQTKEEN